MARPHLADLGNEIVGITSGKTGEAIKISNKSTIDELRVLIKQRKELGLEISKKLIADGLHTANEDEDTEIVE